jgi:hypothetical protein
MLFHSPIRKALSCSFRATPIAWVNILMTLRLTHALGQPLGDVNRQEIAA